jgi:hypothetical protein
MGSLFDVKNFRKKFFDDAYFSEPKNSGEKFFCDAYFRGGNSEMDFSLFYGWVNLGMLHFNFCCVNIMGFLQGHFLRSNFWGKKFAESSTFVF